MTNYNFDIVRKNIFHELNKMLVALTKEEDSQHDSALYHRIVSENEMIKYYLKFPLKIREIMAVKMKVSERTLHRFYEDPLKILDNHEAIINLSEFLSYSYQYFNYSLKIYCICICKFFK